MSEHSGTKQRGRICAFNMLMCAVVIGLAGTLGAGTVTRATLQGEIDAAAARGGGKVTVPAGGHFMEGPLHLRSNVELVLADGAELVFTDDPKAYLPAVVLAGSATYAVAERAAREHPELVGRLIRAQGEKTVLPQ